MSEFFTPGTNTVEDLDPFWTPSSPPSEVNVITKKTF